MLNAHALTLALASVAAATPSVAGGAGPQAIKLQDWVEFNDLPRDAGFNGHLTLRIAVDVKGSPITCQVTTSSGTSRLNEEVCVLFMARGHFKPALDEASLPVTSIARLRFHLLTDSDFSVVRSIWDTHDVIVSVNRLPGAATEDVSVRQIVDASDKVESCVVEKPSRLPPLDRLACQQVADQPNRQAVDNAGKPMRTLNVWRVAFTTQPVPANPVLSVPGPIYFRSSPLGTNVTPAK